MDQSILNEIARLPKLPHAELKERWRDLFGAEPKVTERRYLIRRLAYRIQELRYGGLSEATRARLREIAEADQGSSTRMTRRDRERESPIPGTRLVREWQGERHEVTAVRGGFEYRGATYRSLSAIARKITGTQWNGPAFFGLRTRGRKER